MPEVEPVEAIEDWVRGRHVHEWAMARRRATDYDGMTQASMRHIRRMLAAMMPGATGIAWGMESEDGTPRPEEVGMALELIVGAAREVAVGLGWRPEREAIPPKLRTLIYRRDGYACVLCGLDDVLRLTIDHRIPVDLGGSNDSDNLRTLCKSCNSRKGARL